MSLYDNEGRIHKQAFLVSGHDNTAYHPVYLWMAEGIQFGFIRTMPDQLLRPILYSDWCAEELFA